MMDLSRYISTGHAVLLTVLLLKISQPQLTQAQVITPAADGTGTIVNRNGRVFDISAGSSSSDGNNVFHSFQTFQLTSGNTANFLTDPSVQRVFARVRANNATFIDGRLQLLGGADLFLLNPNGIIFGPNARLNLSADFTATTASHITFESGRLNAIGTNSYNTLLGSPLAFAFGQSGTIRNAGNLTLLPGQSLTLLGSEIVNTGSLTAETIQIREVSEEQIVRVSQTGSILSLEFSGDAFQDSSSNVTSSTLPGLLTSGTANHAEQIITNADGQVALTDATSLANLPGNTPAVGPTGRFENQRLASQNLTLANTSNNRESQFRPSSEERDPNETPRLPPRSRIASHYFHRTVLNTANASAVVTELEDQRNQDFSSYFGRDLQAKALTLPEIQQLLTQVQAETGNQSVIVYVKAPKLATDGSQQNATALELLILQSTGDPINLEIPNVSQAELFKTIEQFRRALISSARLGSKRYLPSAQKLYGWLIKPIEDQLGPDNINTVLFSMDSGLRSLPIAALHDGQQFLIEKYSVGMVPSLGLMQPHYQPLGNARVLAMGASLFKELQPLPAVPTELENIGQLWPSRGFLNESFTRQNLIEQQKQTPAQIIHLATHAEFNAGNADQSYIQLWDEQLHLSDIHTLGWEQPAVDLLVLSACRTALGNANAEMGFAGLAVAAGVNSALASLWTVSDVGTLALMSEFYHQLQQTSIKSEALRATQLAMLNAEIRIESGQLLSNAARSTVPLPSELSELDNIDFSHPYYWSGFTMIGNPW